MHSFILWNSQLQSLRLYLNLCSMIHVYAYTDSKHSATPMSIESKYYTSDANGNQDSIPNIERRMYWDEDNRLMVLSDNDFCRSVGAKQQLLPPISHFCSIFVLE